MGRKEWMVNSLKWLLLILWRLLIRQLCKITSLYVRVKRIKREKTPFITSFMIEFKLEKKERKWMATHSNRYNRRCEYVHSFRNSKKMAKFNGRSFVSWLNMWIINVGFFSEMVKCIYLTCGTQYFDTDRCHEMKGW